MTPDTARAAPARSTMPPHAVLFLAIGLIAMSFASILIRYAQTDGVPSLFIAAGRLTAAALILTPFALSRHWAVLRMLRRGDLLLAGTSGALLALHFATWIASLEYTSVLVSVVLVSTSPLWVALLEWVFLRARLRPLVIAGLVVAILGGVFIGLAGGSTMTGSDPTLGGALALTGAVAIALYLVIGRKLRARLPLLPYIWLVYGCAAVALLLAVAVTGTSVTGYSTQSYVWILLLALLPQLIGHSSLNYALRYLSATFVSIVTQMEPVGSALLAFVVFREQPAPLQIAGSAAILAGILLATFGQKQVGEAAPDPLEE